MKKTKIICSIGPASEPFDVMKEMLMCGMNVARINFSHADVESNDRIVETINKVRLNTGVDMSILYDTKGPEFRCGVMQDGGVNLVEGNTITLVKNDVIGNEQRFSVNYPNALDNLNPGNIIYLEDGLMKLKVESCNSDGILCTIIEGGILNSKKGINVPSVNLRLPFLSNQDIEDIKYACSHDGDFLALSFVESVDNINTVKDLLKENGREDMQIISKIECNTALDNLDDIIDASDGIMVARGDLGVEVPIQKLPIIQKDMIRKCREKGKFVIVATEMLASMYTSSRPTRAEVTDISNAVLDGADAVMLSGETTVGKHPIDAVKYMASICEEAEKAQKYQTAISKNYNCDITEIVANAVKDSVDKLDIKAVVVPTTGGHSAMVISNQRPNTVIIAICSNIKVSRRLSLYYGIYPKIFNINEENMDDLVIGCREVAIKMLDLKEGDNIIIAGGIHANKNFQRTNFLKIEEI